MITSISEFQNILRAVAIHHKPADLCNRLNSFAVVDRMTQLNATNAEMVMQHYTQGMFWARDWYNQGAKPNALCTEYDMLVLEAVKGAQKTDITDRGFTVTLYLVVVGKVDPGGKCPCTIEGKRTAVMKTLNEVVTELVSYQQYEIDPATGSNFTGWASEGQAAAMILAGTWTSATPTGRRLDVSLIQPEGFAFWVPEWNSLKPFGSGATGRNTLIDGVVAVATQINLEICNPNTAANWKYDVPSANGLGVVKCVEC